MSSLQLASTAAISVASWTANPIVRWTSSITCCVFTSDPALMTSVIILKEKAWLRPRQYAPLRFGRSGSGGTYFSFGYRILTVCDPAAGFRISGLFRDFGESHRFAESIHG